MKHMHDQFDMKINKFMDTMVMKSFMDWVTDSHIFAFAMFISQVNFRSNCCEEGTTSQPEETTIRTSDTTEVARLFSLVYLVLL